MPFSTDMASLVANLLSRFVTLNPYQLAGQVAILDFWLAEIRHALAVIDGYGVRFVRMEGGQEQFVTTHRTTISELEPAGPKERRPPLPRRISDRELREARRDLTEATRRFLERCRQDGLISEPQLSAALVDVGIEQGRKDVPMNVKCFFAVACDDGGRRPPQKLWRGNPCDQRSLPQHVPGPWPKVGGSNLF